MTITLLCGLIVVLIGCNLMALACVDKLKKDLKVWEAVYESTASNNAKLMTQCENLMTHNKDVMNKSNETIAMIDNDWKNLFNLYKEDLATHRHLLDQYDILIAKIKGLVENSKHTEDDLS